jgi:hypothetical protein
MRRTAGLLIAGLLTLTLAACSDDAVDVGAGDGTTTTTVPPATVPGSIPDIRGTITSVTPFEPVTEDCTPPEDLDPDDAVSSEDPPVCTDPDTDVLGSVLVEEQPGVQEGRKISFTLTSATSLVGTTFDDLAKGQTVEAWTTGLCAESYPEQCGTLALRVTG